MFSEFVTQNLIWFAALVLIANLIILSFIQGRVKGAALVSALELPQLQRGGKSVIVDVNAAKDFAVAHIPDAVNFSIDTIRDDNKDLMKLKNKTVIVTCQTGSKSTKAAKELINIGFEDIHILRGGLISWTKENLPVTSS